MIYPEVKRTAYEIESDKAQLRAWLALETDEPDSRYELMKSAIALAIREELTPVQKRYLAMYYYENMAIQDIADECGVNKATVSRTIHRAEDRLAKVLRYAFKLLRAPFTPKRNRKRRKQGDKTMRKLYCYGKQDYCDKAICNGCDVYDGSGAEYRKTETIADRIRAMSDQELADFLNKEHDFCKNLPKCHEQLKTDELIPDQWCAACMLEWLRQPVDDTKPTTMTEEKQDSGLVEES